MKTIERVRNGKLERVYVSDLQYALMTLPFSESYSDIDAEIDMVGARLHSLKRKHPESNYIRNLYQEFEDLCTIYQKEEL